MCLSHPHTVFYSSAPRLISPVIALASSEEGLAGDPRAAPHAPRSCQMSARGVFVSFELQAPMRHRPLACTDYVRVVVVE
jgi:hypothetical protein